MDFYTGLIYKAMGFPTKMFTVLFAIGRLPGWIAQWREMITDPATKIGRPRQVYTGYTERDYVRAGRPGLSSRDQSALPILRGGPRRLILRGGSEQWLSPLSCGSLPGLLIGMATASKTQL